ncbi:MAG: hypothetical protein AAFX80_15780 [Cyanobacteria bacterium J06639_18]
MKNILMFCKINCYKKDKIEMGNFKKIDGKGLSLEAVKITGLEVKAKEIIQSFIDQGNVPQHIKGLATELFLSCKKMFNVIICYAGYDYIYKGLKGVQYGSSKSFSVAGWAYVAFIFTHGTFSYSGPIASGSLDYEGSYLGRGEPLLVDTLSGKNYTHLRFGIQPEYRNALRQKKLKYLEYYKNYYLRYLYTCSYQYHNAIQHSYRSRTQQEKNYYLRLAESWLQEYRKTYNYLGYLAQKEKIAKQPRRSAVSPKKLRKDDGTKYLSEFQ